MTQATIRAWYGVHKWTSLVCTLFLLLLCITGLPLIFYEEIDSLGGGAAGLSAPAKAPSRNLDEILKSALVAHPGDVGLYMTFDEHRPVAYVTTAATSDAPEARMHFQTLDLRSAAPIPPAVTEGAMDFLFHLHTDLFVGLPGLLFMGLMGLLFFVSIISGVVVYAPFMRKLDFGTVRTSRSRRLKWLDYHNLLGIVTVAWACVVGFTGVINTLAEPIIGVWRQNQLAELTAPYAKDPLPTHLASLQDAVNTALSAAPSMQPLFVAFPGTPYSSRHHYAVFMQGSTPLTKKLLTPTLIDAQTGKLTASRALPWYVQALLLSQPLHFGDYGGMPMKLLWAVLDVVTIVVLGSGVYLWLGRRRSPIETRLAELQTGGVSA